MSIKYKASGLQRVAMVIAAAVTGVAINVGFALVDNRAIGTGDMLLAALIGALLGLWISFGERRRKK